MNRAMDPPQSDPPDGSKPEPELHKETKKQMDCMMAILVFIVSMSCVWTLATLMKTISHTRKHATEANRAEEVDIGLPTLRQFAILAPVMFVTRAGSSRTIQGAHLFLMILLVLGPVSNTWERYGTKLTIAEFTATAEPDRRLDGLDEFPGEMYRAEMEARLAAARAQTGGYSARISGRPGNGRTMTPRNRGSRGGLYSPGLSYGER